MADNGVRALLEPPAVAAAAAVDVLSGLDPNRCCWTVGCAVCRNGTEDERRRVDGRRKDGGGMPKRYMGGVRVSRNSEEQESQGGHSSRHVPKGLGV